MKNQLAESIHVEFNDNSVLSSLFGVYDSNIHLLEKMNNVKINLLGWILFLISAIGFIKASVENFWTMFGSVFFLIACIVFLIPFLNMKKKK